MLATIIISACCGALFGMIILALVCAGSDRRAFKDGYELGVMNGRESERIRILEEVEKKFVGENSDAS